MNILIVDDDKILRKGLNVIITNNTPYCVCDEAKNGIEALEILKEKNDIDVVVTDIKMPSLDGLGLISETRKAGNNVKFIVLSGFDDYVYVRQALTVGAVDYLLKPIDKKVLLDLLKRMEMEIEAERKNQQKEAQLYSMVGDSLSILHEKVLKKIIGVEQPSIKNFKEHIKTFGIENANLFCVATFKVHNISGDVWDMNVCESPLEGMVALTEAIHREVEELKSEFNIIQTAIGQSIVILFYSQSMGTDCMEKLIRGFACDVNARCKGRISGDLTCGLSEFFTDIAMAVNAYLHSNKCADARFYEDSETIITYSYEKLIYNTLSIGSSNLIQELEKAIEFCDANQARKLCVDIIGFIGVTRPEPEYAREYMSRIFNNICMNNDKFREVCTLFASERLDIPNTIKFLDTLDAIRRYVSEAIPKIVTIMRNMCKSGSKGIIEAVKEHIKTCYHEDISLKDLAVHVHMNPNYLSELFKNETGKNVIEYLTEVRMTMAKKLLSDPQAKVYEVGYMVGYNEPVSFNRAFKRVVGVTPKEYRKLVSA